MLSGERPNAQTVLSEQITRIEKNSSIIHRQSQKPIKTLLFEDRQVEGLWDVWRKGQEARQRGRPPGQGLQQEVPAAGVARGDPGAERGAPLVGDAEPAGGDTGSGFAQGGDAAGTTVGWVSLCWLYSVVQITLLEVA